MDRLYEQCSAASTFCVQLTKTAQVYGGSLSLVVGAYLWSYSQQQGAYPSRCSAGVAVVSGLLMELNNIRISGSQAGTYAIGGALQSRNHTFCLLERLDTWLIVLTHSNAGSSSGSNVRRAQRLSHAFFQLVM
jgi:hypothetical protein